MSRLSILLVALVACKSGPHKQTADSLTAQTRVAVSVSSTPQGLAAAAIVAERSAAAAAEAEGATDEPGGVDCQNGLDPKGQPCDGGPAANADDGAPETAAAGHVVVPRAMLQANGSGYSALGLTIADGSRLPDGAAVRFIGSLDATGRFVAVATRATSAATGRLMGKVESVSRGTNGEMSLRVLGQTVRARNDLPLSLVTSVETAADQDKDGVTCEQSGDAQGDNSGCTPP
jgi:hypothetical protein